MLIYDAFLFHNELDLLEIRLHELDPVVDRFVLVEGDRTFTGSPKPSSFPASDARFARYRDKIEHVIVSDWPEDPDPWAREFHQRDALIRGSEGLDDRDIMMVSDVDEIPSRAAVAAMRGREESSFAFTQVFSYFRFDFIRQNHAGPIASWTIAERAATLRDETVSSRRGSRHKRIKRWMEDAEPDLHVFADAGWHASYFGDDTFVRDKIAAFSHQEYNTPEFLATIDVDRLLADQADLFGRDGAIWRVADTPIALPHLVREQPERFGNAFVHRDIQLGQDLRRRSFG